MKKVLSYIGIFLLALVLLYLWGLGSERQFKEKMQPYIEQAEEHAYDDGHSDGYRDGYNDGYNDGYDVASHSYGMTVADNREIADEGYNEGFDDGYTSGYNDGHMDGEESGYEYGYDDALSYYGIDH